MEAPCGQGFVEGRVGLRPLRIGSGGVDDIRLVGLV
jgi:hypothetical protein